MIVHNPINLIIRELVPFKERSAHELLAWRSKINRRLPGSLDLRLPTIVSVVVYAFRSCRRLLGRLRGTWATGSIVLPKNCDCNPNFRFQSNPLEALACLQLGAVVVTPSNTRTWAPLKARVAISYMNSTTRLGQIRIPTPDQEKEKEDNPVSNLFPRHDSSKEDREPQEGVCVIFENLIPKVWITTGYGDNFSLGVDQSLRRDGPSPET